MITISAFSFNPFQENTYVVSDATGHCIIIDAGNYSPAEDRKLSTFIADKEYTPFAAVNTHGHIDHILGIGYLKEKYGIPFALHGEDNFLVESAPMHGKLYGFTMEEPPATDIDLKNIEKFTFGETTLEIIHTPGHTPGHVCLFDPVSRSLFTGDTLFRESIGRTDLPGGDYTWIMRSILDKIIPLGDDVKIFPGHGPASTIGHEVLYNPFVTEVLNGEVDFR